MNATDLAGIHDELRHIVLILYVVGALTVIAVVLACIRTYRVVKQNMKHLDPFVSEASDLLEKGELERLFSLASTKIQERRNHAYARWYLALALYHQNRFAAAIEEFEALRKLQPDWAANYIDPYLHEARANVTSKATEAM
jgi:cytochrome c-type biogenesis protein CcmH/NrfG